jgi:hypothetical protein
MPGIFLCGVNPEGRVRLTVRAIRSQSVGHLFKFNVNTFADVRAMPLALLEQGARFSLALCLDEPFFNAGDSKGTV